MKEGLSNNDKRINKLKDTDSDIDKEKICFACGKEIRKGEYKITGYYDNNELLYEKYYDLCDGCYYKMKMNVVFAESINH